MNETEKDRLTLKLTPLPWKTMTKQLDMAHTHKVGAKCVGKETYIFEKRPIKETY